MPLILGVILWVLGVAVAVGIGAWIVDGGFVALPVILLVLAITAVVGIAAYMLDKSTSRLEHKD